MALVNVFAPASDSIVYSQVIGGLISINGEFYKPSGRSVIPEGTRIKAIKMPDSLRFNGSKVILVKGERWVLI